MPGLTLFPSRPLRAWASRGFLVWLLSPSLSLLSLSSSLSLLSLWFPLLLMACSAFTLSVVALRRQVGEGFVGCPLILSTPCQCGSLVLAGVSAVLWLFLLSVCPSVWLSVSLPLTFMFGCDLPDPSGVGSRSRLGDPWGNAVMGFALGFGHLMV